jgi:hypothetical protein
VNSLGELIIFRMLGAYVDSSGTLIPALWVHLSPLSGCRWTSLSLGALCLHSGTSDRVIVYEDFGSGIVIPLFKGRCSADDLSLLIGIVAW